MTVTLSWWAVPVVLLLVAGCLFWLGGRERGMFAGWGHALLGCALVVVASAFSVGYQAAGWA